MRTRAPLLVRSCGPINARVPPQFPREQNGTSVATRPIAREITCVDMIIPVVVPQVRSGTSVAQRERLRALVKPLLRAEFAPPDHTRHNHPTRHNDSTSGHLDSDRGPVVYTHLPENAALDLSRDTLKPAGSDFWVRSPFATLRLRHKSRSALDVLTSKYRAGRMQVPNLQAQRRMTMGR